MGAALLRQIECDPEVALAGVVERGGKLPAGDVLVDFTNPSATTHLLGQAVMARMAVVLGTTGLDAVGEAAVRAAATAVPVVWAANTSLGVTVLAALVERAAAALQGYDLGVFEMHHRHKLDAPSGTALALGRAAAAGASKTVESVGMASLRGGEEIGVHTVTIAGPQERLELTHRSFSRDVYAAGAVRAALWLRDRTPSLYTMKDVLGL